MAPGRVACDVGPPAKQSFSFDIMPRIQRILVPIDFSGSTSLTLRCAAEMAKTFSARLTLYHVLHTVLPPATPVPWALEQWSEESEKDAASRLRELAASLGGDVQSEIAVEAGVPWDSIVGRATKDGSDLIVMATHGRTGLKHVLLGSVAERVSRHAPCSVMIVRQHAIPAS